MLKYLNGKIERGNDTTTLTIFLSTENGTPFLENLGTILTEYTKHVDELKLVNGESNLHEISLAFDLAHKNKLSTCWAVKELSNTQMKKITGYKIDRLCVGNELYVKEYSPFGDAIIWEHVQSGCPFRELV